MELGNRDYQVVLTQDLAADSDSLGEINYPKCIIQLDAGLLKKPASLLEVLIHEIQHGLNECYHLNKLKEEEEFTDQQAVQWATLLRRNRWLAEVIYQLARA